MTDIYKECTVPAAAPPDTAAGWVPAESCDELTPFEGELLRDVMHDLLRNGADA